MASVSTLDVQEGGSATFTIKLDQQPTRATVLINFVKAALSDSPASNLTVSPDSLTFTGGPTGNWNTEQTVTVTAKDEDLLGDQSFVIRASYAIPDTRTSVNVTVKDNDDLVPTFGDGTVADQTWTQYSTVDLTLPAATGGDGTLTYALTGTLPAGLSFDAATRKIAGKPTATQAATDYTYTVTDGDASSPDSASLTFKITVNAPPPGVTLLETALTAAEADDTSTTDIEEHKATYRVVLNTDPGAGATVRVTPTSSATGTATVSPSSLSFTGGTSGTWDTPQTVTVTAVDDDVDNASDRTATVTHTVSGYPGVSTVGSVTVTVNDDDTAGVTVSEKALSVAEADDTSTTGTAEHQATYTVVLDTDPGGGTTVTVTPASSATGTATVSPSSLSFTGGASGTWGTPQTVTVSGVNDDLDNAGDRRTATVTHTVDGYPGVAAAGSVTVTVNDDDGVPALTFGGATIADQSYTYDVAVDVTLPVATGSDSTITYSLEGVLPTGLTFNPSTRKITGTPTVGMSKTRYAYTATDGTKSATLKFNIAARGAFGATVPEVSVVLDSTTVPEGGTTLVHYVLTDLPVKTGSTTTDRVTVTLSSSDANVATLNPTTLEFFESDWNVSRPVTVTGVEDKVTGNRNVTINTAVSAPDTNYANRTVPAFGLTVVDNDVTRTPEITIAADRAQVTEGDSATFTLTASSAPGSNLSVSVNVTTTGDFGLGSNTGARTVTIPANATTAAYTLTTTGDNTPESNGSVTVELQTGTGYTLGATSSASVAVTDDDDLAPTFGNQTIAGQTWTRYSTVDVTLPAATGGDGTLTYALTGTLPAGLTFDATARKIAGKPTATHAATHYTYTVTDADASNPDSASLTFTIAVNAPPPGVTLLETALTAAEADDTSTPNTAEHQATYRVVLNTDPGAGATVTVTPASSATGTATVSGALSFTGGASGTWDTPQTVTVTAVDDDVDNASDRTAIVTHTVSGYPGVTTVGSVTVTVNDDDTAGVTVSETALTVAEADDTSTSDTAEHQATYTVVLDTDPGAGTTVTVTPASSATGTATVSGALSFTGGASGTWDEPQTVTVSGVDDDVDNAGDKRAATIDHTVSGYPGVTTAGSVTMTVTDDDTAGVTVSETALTVAEADDADTNSVAEHQATYTVVLDTDPGPGTTVTVTPASSATGAATVSPSSLSFTGGASGTWDEPQTVTVSGVNDDLENTGDTRAATITHTVGGYPGVTTAGSVTVTVTDDDDSPLGPTVAPVAGSGTALDVSWAAVSGASGYRVQWKLATASSYRTTGDRHTTAANATGYRITGLTAGTSYIVKVTALDDSTDPATELASAQVSGATHSPLLGLAFDPTASSDTSLTVSWTAVPGAASYRVRWRKNSETDFPSANTGNPTATRYTITGLSANTTYTFEVTAIVSGTADNPDGLASRGSAATFPALAGLTVRPVDFSNSALDVSWNSVSGAQGYRVQWKTGNERYSTTQRFHDIAGAATTSWRIAELTPGATYRVRVTSRHRVGGSLVGRATGEASATANSVLPGLTVTPTAGSTTALDVRWTAPAGARGYRVEWKSGRQSFGASSRSEDIADQDATSHRIAGLAAGVAYDVRVTAYRDVSGNLLPRDVDVARQRTFGVLTGLSVAAVAGADSQLDVSWTRVTGTVGYTVQWKSGDQEYATTTRRVLKGVNDTSHRIRSLAPDTAHDIRVTARVNVGDTTVDGDADEASATTHRTLADLAVAASGGSSTELTAAWTPVTGASGYRVRWKLAGASSYPAPNRADIASGSTGTHRITGLAAVTAYDVEVTARVTVGGVTVDGDADEAGGTTHRALTGLTVAGVAGSSDVLDVSWMAVTGASGYRVQWKLAGAKSYPTTNQADIASGSTVTHRITGLSARTAYTVRVTARVTVAGATVDGGGAEAGASTDSGAVGAVPNLAAAPVDASTGKLRVSWSAVADAHTYIVWWKDTSQSYDTARSQSLGSTATSHTITGLTASTEYTVRVDANDDSVPNVQLLARSEVAAATHPEPTFPPGFSGARTGNRAIPDFVLTQGQPGPTWVLPKARGGDGTLTYTMSPALPTGCNNPATADGVLACRPTATQSPTRYAWRATDEDGDFAELTFTIEVVAQARPITFGSRTVPDLYLTVGEQVDLLMPPATGNEPIEYRVWPEIGLNVGSREDIGYYTLCPRSGCRLTGRVSGDAAVKELELRARYRDPLADATLKFTVHAAAEDLAPSFGDTTVSNQSWTQYAPIAVLTLPQATGGNGPLTYALSPALPAGLSFNAGSRRITGTPTVAQPATEYTWKATDSDTMNPESAELTFTIAVPAPTPGVTVSTASVTVAEADDTSTGNDEEHRATWTVRLNSDPGDGATVTVTPSSSVVGAAEVSGALTFIGGPDGDWATPQTVTVTGIDDAVDNAGDRRTATVSHAVGGYGSVTEGPSVTVTVTDDDTAGATFDRASVTVSEAGGEAAYTVVLNTEPTGEVTVTPTSSATGAATVSPAALTFTGGPDGDWDTPQTVTVTGVNDNVGGNRSATVSHTFAGGGYAAVTGTVAVTVTNDDPVIAPGSLTIPEGGRATVRFRLTKAPGPNERVIVAVQRYSTNVTLSGLRFHFNGPGAPKWNEYQAVTVGAPENTDVGDLSTTLSFSASVGGNTRTDLLNYRNYRVTVKDNDGPAVNLSASSLTVAETDDTSTGSVEEHKATWTVVLNTDPGDGATVTVTPSSSATDTATVSGALTFTGGSDGTWATPQTVTVTAVDDAVDNDPDRTATVSHAVTGYAGVTAGPSVTVTVTDDEAADTAPSFGDATVPDQSWIRNATIAALVLPEASGGEGTLTYSLEGALPAGVSFDPATRRITGAPTAVQAATGYTWTATDGDGDTDSLTFDIAVAEPRRVLVTPTALVFGEAGSGTYTVALSRAPEGEVVITPASVDVSVATVSGSLLFTGGADGTWATPQTVTVTGVPETAMQRDRSTTVTHSIAGYGSATVPDVTVSTTDAASSPALVVSATAAEVAEDGGEGTWTVRLASVPSAAVTVTLASSSTADATVTPAALTFDRTNWFRPRTVTVRGVDDDDDNDPDRTATVTHTASGSGSGYESVAAATVTVTLTDDDNVSFGQSTVPDQYWKVNEAIPSLTLPEAAGGEGALTYSLTVEPALDWLSFDAATRALSGTPTAAATATATLTAQDAHGGKGELTFDIAVWTPLTFGTESIDDLVYTRNAAIEDDVLLEATGGVAPLTYAISPDLPAGLSFDPATRTLSGTPSALHTESTFTYKATDSLPGTPNEAALTFTLEVVQSLPPTFGSKTVPDFVASVGQARSLELPAASEGAGTLTYSITPALPAGVSLSGHTLTFNPTAVQAEAEYTYTATDAASRSAELTFTIEVVADDLVPTFGDQPAVEHLFIRGQTIDVTLPEATGGNEPLTYTVLGGSPHGTLLDLETLRLTGTPGTVGRATQTLTVRDLDQDEDELSWNYEVVDADLTPSFGNATIADQSWTRNVAIAALTLPEATGGNGALSYRLEGTLPAGVRFDAATRRITGAPTATQAAAEYTWKVTDSDTVNPETVELTFSIEVILPALTGLDASAVSGKGAELTVSWAAYQGAEKYRVRRVQRRRGNDRHEPYHHGPGGGHELHGGGDGHRHRCRSRRRSGAQRGQRYDVRARFRR